MNVYTLNYPLKLIRILIHNVSEANIITMQQSEQNALQVFSFEMNSEAIIGAFQPREDTSLQPCIKQIINAQHDRALRHLFQFIPRNNQQDDIKKRSVNKE